MKKPAFVCPIPSNPRISSPYPRRLSPPHALHLGVDYAVVVGTKGFAPANGEVLRADCKDVDGYGNQIRIWHPQLNLTTVYGHLSKMLVVPGQKVTQGTLIVKTGGDPNDDIPGDGHTSGAHLHFETRIGKQISGKATLSNTKNPLAVIAKFAKQV